MSDESLTKYLEQNGIAAGLNKLLPLSADLPVDHQLMNILNSGFGTLPSPGGGETLQRWRALSDVALHNMSLAKLYEGHTDAVAILQELDAVSAPIQECWAMWAAESPSHRVRVLTQDGTGQTVISGTKFWCSGARVAKRALLTAWLPDEPECQLVSVNMSDPSIRIASDAWSSPGMVEAHASEVVFDQVPATLVGRPGDYLRRPGFWHGGAGIAACWYGGTLAVADKLYKFMQHGDALHPGRPYLACALGKVDRVLGGLVALLHQSAAWIDANPEANAMAVALRARQAAEAAAMSVLEETGRALGATPFTRDAAFARAVADLQLFIRQSHGDRDDAALATAILERGEYPWKL